MQESKKATWSENNNANSFKRRDEFYNENCSSLEDSGILLKDVTKAIESETKEQKGRFLGMLLGTLGASLLGNILAGKCIVRPGYGDKGQRNSKSWL